MHTGLVIRNTGSWYTVKTDDGGQLIDCKIKGNFRLKGIRSTNPVAVGDHVTLVPNNEGTAFITDISDRRNYIIRKSQNLSKQSHILAANVDMAMLVVTVAHPQTSTTFIDRFLASAEAYAVPAVLVFNKTDILSPEEAHYQQMMTDLYGRDKLRTRYGNAHDNVQRDAFPAPGRICHRHSRHQGLRNLRYGAGGDFGLL